MAQNTLVSITHGRIWPFWVAFSKWYQIITDPGTNKTRDTIPDTMAVIKTDLLQCFDERKWWRVLDLLHWNHFLPTCLELQLKLTALRRSNVCSSIGKHIDYQTHSSSSKYEFKKLKYVDKSNMAQSNVKSFYGRQEDLGLFFLPLSWYFIRISTPSGGCGGEPRCKRAVPWEIL